MFRHGEYSSRRRELESVYVGVLLRNTKDCGRGVIVGGRLKANIDGGV